MQPGCGNGTRSAPASGLAFVVCFAVAAALYGSGAGSTQASIAAYYTHQGGRRIAGLVVLLAAGNALWAATAFTVELEPGYVPSASSHLLLEDAGWIVIVSAAALAIPFVAVVSWERGSAWLRVLGGATVLALAAAYWYVPLAVFLAWILAESLSGAGASRAARSGRIPS